MKIIYFTIVWGEDYIRKFLLYTLPSILSNKNIEVIKSQTYYIYTDNIDSFVNNINYKKLQSICNVVPMGLIGDSRDSRIKECVKDATLKAFSTNSIIRLFAPDVIISNGLLPNNLSKLNEGYDATIFPFGGLRVNEKEFLEEYKLGDDLVQLFFKHIHFETQSHYIDSKTFFHCPVMKIENNRVSSFYNQPGYIRINNIDNFGGYDNYELNFVNSLVDSDKVYCIKDANEGFEVSLTQSKWDGWGNNKYNENDFFSFNTSNVNPVSKLCFDSGYLIGY